MAELPVYNASGEEVGTYSIEWTDLAPTINKQLLHDVVVMYQANLRQGSHHSKSRGEVQGSKQKLYRQKGTGRARAGSKKAHQRRGGGHYKAKRPRDYSYRLPVKAVRLATRMAIASKVRDNEIVVVDDLPFEQPKTKQMAGVLSALKLSETTTLIATADLDANVYKSARNIDKVTVSPVADLNALAVLKPRRMLVTRAALDRIKERAAEPLRKPRPAAEAAAASEEAK
jgi:large subunit ribosomal protein L4